MSKIRSIDLPIANRTMRDFEILSNMVPLADTELLLCRRSFALAREVCKITPKFKGGQDLLGCLQIPEMIKDKTGKCFFLRKTTRMRGYCPRGFGNFRVCRYRGYYGDGFMLMSPCYKSSMFSWLSYYVDDVRFINQRGGPAYGANESGGDRVANVGKTRESTFSPAGKMDEKT